MNFLNCNFKIANRTSHGVKQDAAENMTLRPFCASIGGRWAAGGEAVEPLVREGGTGGSSLEIVAQVGTVFWGDANIGLEIGRFTNFGTIQSLIKSSSFSSSI